MSCIYRTGTTHSKPLLDDNAPRTGRLVGYEVDCPRTREVRVRRGAAKSLPAFLRGFVPVRYNEDTDEIEVQYKKPEPQASKILGVQSTSLDGP